MCSWKALSHPGSWTKDTDAWLWEELTGERCSCRAAVEARLLLCVWGREILSKPVLGHSRKTELSRGTWGGKLSRTNQGQHAQQSVSTQPVGNHCRVELGTCARHSDFFSCRLTFFTENISNSDGTDIGRLLTFYPKYHLEWQVDQLAGRAARAAGLGAQWGRPSRRRPYRPASRFYYPLHLCPTLKSGRQEMGKGAPGNIQAALPVGALRWPEQRGTPAASPVTTEV